MSIIIHISKGHCESSTSKDRSPNEDSICMDDNYDNVSINLPKHNQAKPNDLSKFEGSAHTSKYSVSGDDLSHLSLDSMIYPRNSFYNQNNQNEEEIEIENRGGKYTTPEKKSSSFYINNYYNNETNNNYSSERVICEELNFASKNMRESGNK